jgi:phage tail sheath protein FI
MPSAPGVYVKEARTGTAPIAGVGTSTPVFIGIVPSTGNGDPPPVKVEFASNFTEFKEKINVRVNGVDKKWAAVTGGLRHLLHAGYGFFQNGGTGCYVTIAANDSTDLERVLGVLEGFEVQLVAAPGVTASANDSRSMTWHQWQEL